MRFLYSIFAIVLALTLTQASTNQATHGWLSAAIESAGIKHSKTSNPQLLDRQKGVERGIVGNPHSIVTAAITQLNKTQPIDPIILIDVGFGNGLPLAYLLGVLSEQNSLIPCELIGLDPYASDTEVAALMQLQKTTKEKFPESKTTLTTHPLTLSQFAKKSPLPQATLLIINEVFPRLILDERSSFFEDAANVLSSTGLIIMGDCLISPLLQGLGISFQHLYCHTPVVDAFLYRCLPGYGDFDLSAPIYNTFNSRPPRVINYKQLFNDANRAGFKLSAICFPEAPTGNRVNVDGGYTEVQLFYMLAFQHLFHKTWGKEHQFIFARCSENSEKFGPNSLI